METPTGPYHAIEMLGRGGMGEVWRGVTCFPGGSTRAVALKFIRPEHAEDPRHRARFAREALMGWDLTARHPGLVTTRGLTTWPDGRLVIVTDLVEGPALGSVVAQLRDDWAVVGYVASEVLGALEFLHGHGVVHRDVSPGNILVGRDGEVYVSDLGLAKLADAVSEGAAVGALAYVAPEVLAGAPASAAADLYALGAVLHELATGQPPARGERARLSRTVPTNIRSLVSGLLTRNPARRLAAGRAAALLAGTYEAHDCAARLGAVADAWLASRAVETVAVSYGPVSSTEYSGAAAVELGGARGRAVELHRDHRRRMRWLGVGVVASVVMTALSLGGVVMLAAGALGPGSSSPVVSAPMAPMVAAEAMEPAVPATPRPPLATPRVYGYEATATPAAVEPDPEVRHDLATVEHRPEVRHDLAGRERTGTSRAHARRVASTLQVLRAWATPDGQRVVDVEIHNRSAAPMRLKQTVKVFGERSSVPVRFVGLGTAAPVDSLEPGDRAELQLWLPRGFREDSAIVRARTGDALAAEACFWR